MITTIHQLRRGAALAALVTFISLPAFAQVTRARA